LTVDDPIVIKNGPVGSRYIYPATGGTFQGGKNHPDFHGTVHGPGGDWACIHPDGSISLDVRLILKTHDGAILFVKTIGRSVRDKNDPKKSSLRAANTFETSDDKWKWLNTKIIVGIGEKVGNNITYDCYDLHEAPMR
jgi:hypothetical protein